MKVNVLTDLDFTFSRFQFWSKWVDISIYYHECKTYLIQMKVSRFNGKRFKVIAIAKPFSVSGAAVDQIGDLTQMSGEPMECEQ